MKCLRQSLLMQVKKNHECLHDINVTIDWKTIKTDNSYRDESMNPALKKEIIKSRRFIH